MKVKKFFVSYPFDAETAHANAISDIILKDYGNITSMKKWSCINKHGNPVPWYTYPAIDYLQQFDFSRCRVFEYGMGNSTLFWSSHAKEVIAVDNNKEWFEKISKVLPENAKAKLCISEDDYVAELTTPEMDFDVIVIDGYYRTRCAKEALNKIKKNGIIILDNTDRWKTNPDDCGAMELLDSSPDFIRVDFTGLGPINPYLWTTSFFLSRSFDHKVAFPKLVTADAEVVELKRGK